LWAGRLASRLVLDITAPLVDFVTNLIGDHGVPMVFGLMTLESMCIPVPSEAVQVFGGFLVGKGSANLFWMIAAGVLGNVLGSWIAYGVGRWKGRDWLLRLRWLHITPQRLDSADRWFEKRGDMAVLISRCLPIIRTFISLPAGIARMPFGRFTVLTLIGCIPWVTGLTLIGKAVGANWESAQKNLHYVDYAVVAAILVGIGVLIVRHRRGSQHAA
jgi:membrane protein DedA with SNARE-associated domain